jgi:hypothetical protein
MALPTLSYFNLTNDLVIDGLTNGYFWQLDSSKTIDYSISSGFNGEYWISPNLVAQYMGAALNTISVYADVSFNYVGQFSTPSYSAYYGSEINLSLSQTRVLF